MKWLAVLGVVSVQAFSTGCTGGWSPRLDPGIGCETGETAMTREVLYFGRNRPGGVVTDGEWTEFVDHFITPRFPIGLTIVSARGQWRNDQGAIEKEKSEVVTILHAGATNQGAIRDITDAYKSRFQQQAVLRERGQSCVNF